MWYADVFQVIILLSETALLLYLTSGALTLRRQKNTLYITGLVVFLLFTANIFLIDDKNAIISKMITWTLFFAATFYLYSEEIQFRVLWVFIYLVIMAVPEAIVVQIALFLTGIPVDQMNNTFELRVLLVILSKLFAFLAIYAVRRIKGRKNIINSYFSRIFYIMVGINVLLLFTNVILYMNYSMTGSNLRSVFLVINITFCIELIVSLVLMFRISQKSAEIIESNKKIQILEGELHLNTQIDISEANLRAIRHNISNIFGIVKGLLDTQSYSELDTYLEEIVDDIQAANELMLLENKALSVLVNNKNALAKSHNIDFKSIISICTIENMPDSDFCALMGNIWDNSIEAARESEDLRYVRTTMQVADDEYIITCENSYKHEPITRDGVFISRKILNSQNSNEEHGIGTKNIKEIVQRYNGEVNYSYGEGEFKLKIVLPIEKADDHTIRIKV